MQLFERVRIISEQIAPSQTALGKALGLSQSKFQGYLNAVSEKNLWQYLPKILETYSQISRDWLYFGEGNMLAADDLPPPLTVQNHERKLVGDLLRVALDWQRLSVKEASDKTGIAENDLSLILDGRLCPSFTQLEALYVRLGIDPSYFFDGNEHWMHVPEDALQRLLWALGKAGRTVSDATLSAIFDVPLEEAKAFYTEWKEYHDTGKNRVLPATWLNRLQSLYVFNPGWLRNMDMPVMTPAQNPRQTDMRDASSLRTENALLRELVDSKQSDLAKAEKLIASYEQRKGGILAGNEPVVPNAPNLPSVRQTAMHHSSKE